MRNPIHLLPALALLLTHTATPLHAEAPKFMQGNWKLLSVDFDPPLPSGGFLQADQRKVLEMYGVYKPNAVWKLDADGTGDCGGTVVKWTYQPELNKMDLELENILGFWATAINEARVVMTPAGVDIHSSRWGTKSIFHLESLDPKPAEAAGLAWTETMVDREVFVETIETIPGLPKKLTVRREYQTSVNATETRGMEAGGRLTVGSSLLASLSAEMKAKMEITLGITIGKKDEFTETYELDGSKLVKIKVKWVERYRQGIMTMSDGSKKNFLVCVGLRTIPEKVQ